MATFDGSDDVQIPEALQCVICLDRLRDAHLCRHCSKMCCFECIKKWLTQYQNRSKCPHCQTGLQLQDFIKCRWGEEVTEHISKKQAALDKMALEMNIKNTVVEDLSQQLKNKEKAVEELRQRELDKDAQKHERCKSHGRKIKFYCHECKIKICKTTAFWNGQHKDHTVRTIREAYDENKEQAKKGLSQLRERVGILALKAVIRDKTTARFQNESNRVSKIITEKLDSLLDEALIPVRNNRECFVRKKDEILSKIGEVESLLKVTCHSEFLDKFNALSRSVQDAVKNSSDPPLPTKLPKFLELVFPSYASAASFVIKGFSKLGVEMITSNNILNACGGKWELQVHPKGCGDARFTHLSVFVHLKSLTRAPSKPKTYYYRIDIVNQKNNNQNKNTNFLKELRDEFREGTAWGRNKFYSLDSLASDGFHDIESDTLILIFQVREALYNKRQGGYQRCALS